MTIHPKKFVECWKSSMSMVKPWLFVLAATTLISHCHCSFERTLAMIKPDGVKSNYQNAIKQIIVSEGFTIVEEKTAHLDEGEAKSFYAEHAERSFFPKLIEFMTSGPVLAMVLEREDAIQRWRTIMGPTNSHKARIEAPNSIRAKFGVDGEKNCVHGSDSPEAALREIAAFFGLTPQASKQDWDLSSGTHDEL